MPLPSGARLNGYEIVELIGAGGMGEVYRARDTRLHRDVALKILPPGTTGNPTSYARFEREAQAVAALSHPNILTIHDSGRTDEAAYVVFELLEGATLRERLLSGPLPVRKAIDYARQVADGLAAAHAQGIAHRDIKPDNLFVTDDGRVKILDFGLAQTARAVPADGVTVEVAHAPITDAGTVLGTVGYMAPEQVRGLAVDHRADLFALGCVLHEMCTGRRAFQGATPADAMTAVLSSDPPDLALSGQPTPPALDRIVRRCLEKQPAERFQSARDLSFALDAFSTLSGTTHDGSAAHAVAPAGSSRSWWILPGVAAVALVAGALAAQVLGTTRGTAAPVAAEGPPIRVEFESTARAATSLLVGLSPDGRFLAYARQRPGLADYELVHRDLGTGVIEGVPDSVGGWGMAWSPRSDALVFNNLEGEFRHFRLGDRVTTPIARMPGSGTGFAWLADDTLVVTSLDGGVQRLPIGGGPLRDVVRDPTFQFALPSAIGHTATHALIHRSQADGRPPRHVVAVDLASGHVSEIVENDAAAVWAAPGYLLLPRTSGLFAAPFDTTRLALAGDPAFVTGTIRWDAATGVNALSSSDAGLIAFRPQRDTLLQFEWLDAGGRSLGRVGPPASYGSFSLSADGTRIVARLLMSDRTGAAPGLSVIDIARGVASQMAFGGGAVSDPVWTVDGTRVLYRRGRQMLSQSPYASDVSILREEAAYPDAVSPDGQWIVFGRSREPQRGFAVVAVSATEPGAEPRAISDGPYQSDEASFSPDGRWVSFQADQSGRYEIYATRFPSSGERWQISPDGGVQARWAPDGRTLYYLNLSGQLMRVSMPAAGPPQAGRPEVLFDPDVGTPSVTLEQYAVSGDRFLFLRRAPESDPETIAVVANWTKLLARAPR
jgi:hypothetical protein